MPEPVRLGDLGQPVGSGDGERVHGRAQSFGNHLQPAQLPHCRQHMRGVGAGLAPAAEEPLAPGRGENAVQHPLSGVRLNQPIPELREDGEVEARIIQPEPEGVLEVDPRADRFRGLPVGQPLDELNTSTSARRPGDQAGRPRDGNRSANSSSVNSGPSSSRTRIARLPFGNAARATRTVSAGISPDPFGCIDIRTHPIRQRRPSRPQPGLEGRRHARPRIDQQHLPKGEAGPVPAVVGASCGVLAGGMPPSQ